MNEEFFEGISPWDEEISETPHHIFQKRIKTASFHIKPRAIKEMSTTTASIARKIKT